MTSCDLDRVYGDLAAALPVSDDDHAFIFTRETVPSPPRLLHTDRLVVQVGNHTWDGCYRSDRLDVFAAGATLRQLGALTLAVLLHPQPATAEVFLTHPASRLKRLRIRFAHLDEATVGDGAVDDAATWFGYWATPTALEYRANDALLQIDICDAYDRPGLRLTSNDELGGVTDEEWDARDTAVGFGGQEATVAMATFLLDAGVPRPDGGEYLLEGPAGNDALEPMSAEVRIALPRSELWQLAHPGL